MSLTLHGTKEREGIRIGASVFEGHSPLKQLVSSVEVVNSSDILRPPRPGQLVFLWSFLIFFIEEILKVL